MIRIRNLILLAFCLLTYGLAQSQEFVVGDFKYTVTSESEKQVSVAAANPTTLSGEVTIPATVTNDGVVYTVTSLADNGFYDCSNLTTLNLPETITSIGQSVSGTGEAFETINVSEENRFYSSENGVLFNKDKTALVKIPDGRTGEYTVPSSVQIIENSAFASSRLSKVTCQEGLREIKDGAFVNSNLTEIIFPESLSIIGVSAFQNCSNLVDITIPAGVEEIGGSAFGECMSLLDINVAEENKHYGSVDGVLFNKDKSTLIQYPAGKSGPYIIPNTVTTIAQGVFVSSKLTEITIPESVTNIVWGAFWYCDNLKKIIDLRIEPQAITGDAFTGVPTDIPVYVPKGSKEAYSQTENWNRFSNFVELPGAGDSFTVGDFKFTILSDTGQEVSVAAANPSTLSGEVTIPATVTNDGVVYTVTSLADSGFFSCSSLTGLNLPETITSVEQYAFSRSAAFVSINVSEENKYYCSEDGVLFNKDKTELVQYPAGRIGEYTVPSSVQVIEEYAFLYSRLSKVTLQEGLRVIKGRAFLNSNLTEIILPESLSLIGEYAFQLCSNLVAINIPAGVEEIGHLAFGQCKSLLDINVAEENKHYSSVDGVLFNKDKSTLIQYPAGKSGSYIIPNTVTTIAQGVFINSKLTEITIPESVTNIVHLAFGYCNNLNKIIDLCSEPQIIDEYVFDGVPTDATVYVPKGCKEAYSQADNWNRFSNFVELPGAGDTFTVGDFKYTILSDTGQDVSVAAANPTTLSGEVTIPATVTNDGVVYTVTSLTNSGFGYCSNLTGLNLPETLTSIGYYAFSTGEAFETISVSEDNNYFSSEDGVLFNKDKTVLAQYPAGRTGEYTVSESVLTIGFGAFHSSRLSQVNLPEGLTKIEDWAFFNSSLTEIVFPESLSVIGGAAFRSSEKLVNINISAGVKEIQDVAFDGCLSLLDIKVAEGNENYGSLDGVLFNKDKSALIQYPAGKLGAYIIPNTVTTIESLGFSCSKLTEITIPASVTTIGNDAFFDCGNLKKIIDLRIEPQAITGDAFAGVPTDITVYVPKGSKEAYSQAEKWNRFSNFVELPAAGDTFTSGDLLYTVLSVEDFEVSVAAADPKTLSGEVTIPATVTNEGVEYTVTSLADDGFSSCSNLTALTLPETITSVGQYAFSIVAAFENINVSEENNYFSSEDGVLFNKDKTELVLYPAGRTGEYSVPESVLTIGRRAFAHSRLNQVSLPEGLTKIEVSAFAGCVAPEIILPESLSVIGDYAFNICSNLVNINIPDGVKKIGNLVFDGCNSLLDITVEESNANYSSMDGILFNKDKSTLIKYPEGKLDGSYIIPNTVTTIEWYGFDHSQFTEITIPASVTNIGWYVFKNCENLKKIIDYSIEPQTIDANVFKDVSEDVTVYVSKGSKEAYSQAENWNRFSNFVELPAVGDTFTSGDFLYTVLSSEEFEVSVAAADPEALAGDVEIPAVADNEGLGYTVTALSGYGFNSCSNLRGLTIPATVTTIGRSAFSTSKVFESIEVNGENSVYSSAEGVLFNKDKTELLTCPAGIKGDYSVPTSVRNIGADAFMSSSLSRVELQEGLKTIGNSAFFAAALTEITLPETLTTISSYAFQSCHNIETVTIPASVSEIGSAAFDGCLKLTDIEVAEDNDSYKSQNGVLYDKEMHTLVQFPAGMSGAFIIPNTVKTISSNGFGSVYNLTEVTIPASVESIGSSAFLYCRLLKRIINLNSNPQAITANVFTGVPTNATLYVPMGSAEKYSEAEVWSMFNDIMEIGEVKVTLSSESLILIPEDEAVLTPTISNESYVEIVSVEWESSDPTVATVGSEGDVKALKDGKAEIRCIVTDSNGETCTAVCQVTVDSSTSVGIVNAEIDYTAPYEVYNLEGRYVGNDTNELSKGMYIVRQGNKTKKILVK